MAFLPRRASSSVPLRTGCPLPTDSTWLPDRVHWAPTGALKYGPDVSKPDHFAAGTGPASEGRARLLRAAEELFARRGFDGVTDREIVSAAGHRNNSAVRYHFGTRTHLIEAIWYEHSAPVNRQRAELMRRFPDPRDVSVRQLVEAHVEPIVTELLRWTPSYWARFNERQLLAMPTRFLETMTADLAGRSDDPPLEVLAELLHLMQRRLRHLTRDEAADRVALTVRWIISGLAGWERDAESGRVGPATLPGRARTLIDLGVALLEAPSNRRRMRVAPPR